MEEKSCRIVTLIDERTEKFLNFESRGEEENYDLIKYYLYHDYKIYKIYNIYIDENAKYIDGDKIKIAYDFAKEKHKNQVRVDNTPYIVHPIKVAEEVYKRFYKKPNINALLAAAYLHDTIEDTDATKEDLEKLFGEYIATIVSNLTNDKEEKNKLGKCEYLSRKVLLMSEDELGIKLCDRLCNIRDLKNANGDFKEKYINETIVIISNLVNNRKLDRKKSKIVSEIASNIDLILRKNKTLSLL